ncbi:type II CRISPR RNA-guided endonuclease Cas9 [uncultured Thiohalocapsa sp.]|uniref:type II CRISPR RNA-guided endonuclease Cas9 n=1 Tax=uncultured Thiohalocapsa sp. TaxID=768990 RepID=UPI0025E87909|nr:type II CRISPR RNA-guided endonuclease Cas9 [uncultured Thiohalocapsa sp.]
MRYRLALDLGTASVGLVAYELNETNAPLGVAYHVVRVFDEPVLPAKGGSVGEPKKAARRQARQQRRQLERRARRLRGLAQVLGEALGLDLRSVPPDPGQHIHALRSASAHERVELPGLLNVLLNLAKRRGYAGGFRAVADDNDDSQVKAGIDRLRTEMAERGCDTLGDYLSWRAANGQTLKLKTVGLYADRDMVREEFERIWRIQATHHPRIAAGGEALRKRVAERIFHQRPLRSPAPAVGNCPLEPSLRRAPMAQPAAQAFRIEKQIADLRWTNGRWSQPLSPAQRGVVRDLLAQHPRQTFTQIYRALQKRGCPRPEIGWLNLDRSSREELIGNKTDAAMARLGLAEDWAGLEAGQRVTVINLLADIGSPETLCIPGWHEQLVTGGKQRRKRVLPAAVVAFIDKLAAQPAFGRLGAMGLDGGRSAYCVKTLCRLADAMGEKGIDEHEAVARLYEAPKTQQQATAAELGRPRPTGNTVVDVALRQVRYTVNAAIRHLGTPPTQIIVELSRDMALGINRRREIEYRINKNQRARRQAAEAIAAHDGRVTHSAIRRYLLWREQDEQWCPYCERPINLSDALDGNATHYEHIYPKSLTRIGKQRDFLVLAHRDCNDFKGNRTPWEAWGEDDARWQIIKQRAARFREKRLNGKAKQLLAQEPVDRALNDKVINDFSARQFHESSWIAKQAARWLREVCGDVAVSRGMLTAHLRRSWALETVIPEARLAEGLRLRDTDGKLVSAAEFQRYRRYWNGDRSGEATERELDKRIDHRHHLIDALVIGLCDRSLYQRMARDYKQAQERGETRLTLRVKPPLPNLRAVAVELVRHCNLSRKADRYVSGRLFQDTAYGCTPDGQHLTKRKAVAELGGGAKATLSKVRKDIDKIVHESTRDLVRQAFERRVAAGRSPAEAISEPIQHPAYGTVIKRVLLLDEKTEGTKAVDHYARGDHLFKHLKPFDNAYLELVAGSGSKFEKRLIRRYEAKNHTMPVGVVGFAKGDTVRHPDNGLHYVVGQIKTERGGVLLLARLVETDPVDKVKGSPGFAYMSSGPALAKLEIVPDVIAPDSSD